MGCPSRKGSVTSGNVTESDHKGPEARQVSLVCAEIFGSICGALLSATIEEGDTGTIVALGRFDCAEQEFKGWDIDISEFT